MIKNKNILIAGGSGLVGINLTKKAIALEANVLSSYYQTEPEREILNYYQQFNFNSFDDCLEATKNKDYVVLCASKVYGAKEMEKNPTASILENLKINAGLLEACARNKVKRVVFLSSTSVYHEAFHPIMENELDYNKSLYPLYQAVGGYNRYLEQLVETYRDVHGIKTVSLRITNIYGPNDQFEDGKSHVLPSLIKRALIKEDPYIVWGNGHTVRDFIYVEDVVDDIIDVLHTPNLPALVLNICNGNPTRIREVVDVILRLSSHNVQPVYDLEKTTAIPYRVIDQTKFQSFFGIKKRTSLEEGIRKTINWYQNND
jgi:GDP-L-fucose synthase